MANMTLWRSLKFFGLTLYRRARTAPAKAALWGTLFVGGVLLLTHALAIGELPEFTWSDITGTLIAVFVAATFFVIVLVGYSLFAGLFARVVLEWFYPEAAAHPDGRMSGRIASWPPYARLIRGPFVLWVTGFVALAWLTLYLQTATDVLKAPYEEQLDWMLVIAWVAMVPLFLLDWTRFKCQLLRHVLLAAWCGSLVVVGVLLTAWSVAPERFSQKRPHAAAEGSTPPPHDWSGTLTWILNHDVILMMVVMGVVLALTNLSWIGGWIAPLMVSVRKTAVWSWSNVACQQVARFARFLLGEASDRRMMLAKLSITATFFVLAMCALFLAAGFATNGDARYEDRNFFMILILLTEFNLVIYMIRTWRGRALFGAITALMLLNICPSLTGNPLFFTKTLVSKLAIGNEHWASVSLSSRQCSTLALYGVRCVANNDQAITLTDVNLLSRLGSNVVLEALVKDEHDPGVRSDAAGQAQSGSSASVHADAMSSSTTLLAPHGMGADSESATRCDKVLLSRLELTDPIKQAALRCVKLVVAKDEVYGHTAAGRGTYRSAYTAYLPGPAKGPTVVMLEEGTNVSSDASKPKLAISAVVR
ncbi:hypothetical protein J3J51_00170 [Burkholderia pseudomallei]|uniref:hypothetical protein n=1 Tax=Burkholderia pseudomallei TaxID=28450 RepID=UPI001A9E0555|nr:hypothetical protein [Burkholderia pseudomallei]QTB44328.1 hypothetical protein J3B47_07280 [Burkholderia pseudomallei]QTB67304.1 hypothetical protein J3J51_00170 [Burkholderia pseudomallei]